VKQLKEVSRFTRVETPEKQSGRVETRRYEIYEIGEIEKAARGGKRAKSSEQSGLFEKESS